MFCTPKFIIKDFFKCNYYTGNGCFGAYVYAETFETYADAENVIKHLPTGTYQIEKVFLRSTF